MRAMKAGGVCTELLCLQSCRALSIALALSQGALHTQLQTRQAMSA